jgi:hypothetical protein
VALVDVATLAADATFGNKVKAAMVRQALSLGGDSTKNDERTAFAAYILRSSGDIADEVIYACAAQANGVAPADDVAVTSLVTTVLIAMARR